MKQEKNPHKNRHLFQPVEVLTLTLNDWQVAPFVYYFFEIAYIVEGTGVRYVNHTRYPYKPGSIFIFTPQDCRSFEIDTDSTFLIVRFTHLLFDHAHIRLDQALLYAWLKKMESIFLNLNKSGIPIELRNSGDLQLLHTLLTTIVEEDQREALHSNENLQYLISILLNVLHRNVLLENPQTATSPELANQMIHYIQENIHLADRLTLDHLADQFPISKTYISEYFKRHTGEGLQNYILKHKVNIARLKLTHTNLTIGTIAGELGFSDESYFYRTFKKAVGLTPAAYRKKEQSLLFEKR